MGTDQRQAVPTFQHHSPTTNRRPSNSTFPPRDREPVKLLVIGSKEAVSEIVHSLHQQRFAEVFEWTDFLPAASETNPLQTRPGEVMKALVKYLPKETR